MRVKRPQDIKDNERYLIVEGFHAGKEGVVVGQEISSFGYVWKNIQLDDGQVISTRWSDLEALPSSEKTVRDGIPAWVHGYEKKYRL